MLLLETPVRRSCHKREALRPETAHGLSPAGLRSQQGPARQFHRCEHDYSWRAPELDGSRFRSDQALEQVSRYRESAASGSCLASVSVGKLLAETVPAGGTGATFFTVAS